MREEENQQEVDLPFTKGRVFISAFYYHNLLQAYFWSIKYPEIEVLVGGPAIRYGKFRGFNLPANLKLTSGLAEKVIFRKNSVSNSWNLAIPDTFLNSKKPLKFSYTLGRRCSWGCCIFCNGFKGEAEKEKLNIGVEYLRVPKRKGVTVVRINIPTVTQHFIHDELLKLERNDKIYYDFFVRGTEQLLKTFKKTVELMKSGFGPHPKQLRIVLGIEFPSNRMLDYMNKGTRVNTLLQWLELAAENNISVGLPFIYGWDNLTYRDIFKARQFIKTVEGMNISNIESACFALEVFRDTPLFSIISKDRLLPMKRKIFDNGEYAIKLGPVQSSFNKLYRSFIMESALNPVHYGSFKPGSIHFQ